MSNYGPKHLKLYSTSDNLKRKQSRTGDSIGDGPNSEVRSYSTKPGQLSAKAQAEAEQRKVRRLSGPVKTYSTEELALFTKFYNVG